MRIWPGIGVTAIIASVIFVLGNAQAEGIHLQIDPQKSQIKTSVADPLGRFRDASQIEGTLRIISGEPLGL